MIGFHPAMECCNLSCAVKAFFFFLALLFCVNISTSESDPNPTYGSGTDRAALLAFKNGVSHDPLGALSSWNNSLHFCYWRGVTCRHGRVIILDLRSQSLGGILSPQIGNLTCLTGINLRHNNFTGEIPHEIGQLIRLQHLNMSNNMLQGQIPLNLTYCSELRFLDLVENQLVGRIPAELGSLLKLVGLGLAINRLSGPIPSSISNLSSLVRLSLSENSLSGNIPEELDRLSKLEFFQLSANILLTGTLPSKLFNISSIKYFAVAENHLHGCIPSDVGLTLPSLKILLLGFNRFSGVLPHSFSNFSGLQKLDFSSNYFSGSVPMNLGRLHGLVKLNLGLNQLGSGKPDDLSFLDTLLNCTRLEVLAINHNHLGGNLPISIANLSAKLSVLYMGANRISGNIPAGIENLVSLTSLAMEENLLTGNIPVSIGKIPNLQILALYANELSGEIPSSIGNITLVSELNFAKNSLHGSIPPSLGNCRILKLLNLSQNKLKGRIPKLVIGLSSLSNLDLSRNTLTGDVPGDIGNLINIEYLDLSENELSGEIPITLENCRILEGLYLRSNLFTGAIPSSLGSLKGLENLDLSLNNLSGPVPAYIGEFSFLKSLNLSSNDFEGEVPHGGIFKNASAYSVLGNTKLCGGISELHLPACSTQHHKNRQRRMRIKTVIVVTGGITCIVMFFLVVVLFRRRKLRNGISRFSMEDMFSKVSYEDLLKGTGGFSSANVVGVGSFGSIYKGLLEETVDAVKVLDLYQQGASRSFTAECDALRNIRHRNLVKIFTSCSSIDFKGDNFKALVFEFMPNGDLDSWLHQEKYLSFMERINIAIDVANAVDYLHHHCHTPIVHCDLKPSNILLDEDMNGHVSDFGISRFLSECTNNASENQTSSFRINGSVGYVAPEYGLGTDACTHGDVYSYGILLLEMFIGRRPTDDLFKEGLSLHTFAKTALPNQVMDITDPRLIQEMSRDNEDFKENLIRILGLGISCSNELPRDRKEMGRAVAELEEIRETYLGKKCCLQRK